MLPGEHREKEVKNEILTGKLGVLPSTVRAEKCRRALNEWLSHYLNTSVSKSSDRGHEDQRWTMILFIAYLSFKMFSEIYFSVPFSCDVLSAGRHTVYCFKMDELKSKNYPTHSTSSTIYRSGVTQCILIDVCVSCPFFLLTCHKFQQYLHLSIAKTAVWQDHHSGSETLH